MNKAKVVFSVNPKLEGRNYDICTVIIRELYKHFQNDAEIVDTDKTLAVVIGKSIKNVKEVTNTHPLIRKCFEELKENNANADCLTIAFNVKEAKS